MTEDWKRGDWMHTYTGKKFYPMNPRVEDICIEDIAHSLSLQCRYNGHVTRFYSVAEHCVHLSYSVSPANALWALLHDATEAYVGDMIRPLKKFMPEYVDAEDRVMVAIAQRFGLSLPVDGPLIMPNEVKDADDRILLTERNSLMVKTDHKWVVDHLEPLPVTIFAWESLAAEFAYTLRFKELTNG